MTSAERRAELHDWLDRLLDEVNLSDEMEAMAEWPRPSSERLHLAEVIKFAAEIAGRSAVDGGEDQEALSSPLIVDRPLAIVAQRIAALAPLMPTATSVILNELYDELVAIAHGDAPAFLLRRAKTGPADGYKDARYKFGALLWSELLKELGVPTARRQAWLSEAYGAPWDTMSRWHKQVAKYLGSDAVERAARHARHRWRLDLQFDGSPSHQVLRNRIFADGHAYKRSVGYADDAENSA